MTVRRVVARQPIVGLDDRIVAFQLLHRDTPEDAPSSSNGADETLTMSALLGDVSVDLGRLVGDVQLYCVPEPGVLEGTTAVTPPTHRTVLDVPADRCSDEGVVDRCRVLVEEGYS